MQPLVNDAERRTAEKLLAAVIGDAQHMADITAAFLKAYGFHPRKKVRSSGSVFADGPTCADDPGTARAKAFLLNLAAALRIALWERAGFRPALPADLPSFSEAFRSLMPPEAADSGEKGPVMSELYEKVLWTWLQHFSRSGHTALGTDVLLPVKAVSQDDLLEAVADLLWANRHLAEAEER